MGIDEVSKAIGELQAQSAANAKGIDGLNTKLDGIHTLLVDINNTKVRVDDIEPKVEKLEKAEAKRNGAAVAITAFVGLLNWDNIKGIVS